jgi:RNA polymerase sigma-54 factor
MRLQADLGVIQRPQLILTARMRLALAVLQAPADELAGIVQEALVSNPFLELEPAEPWEPGDAGSGDPDPGDEGYDPMGGDGLAGTGAAVATVRREWDDVPRVERIPDPGEWRDRLLSQYRAGAGDARDERIVEYLLGCLDGRGYLAVGVRRIAAALGVSVGRVERVRARLLDGDPPGIGARNLVECLLAQLRHSGEGGSLAERVVERDLEWVARRRFAEIAARHGVTVESARRVARRIRGLWPHPATRIAGGGAPAILPDLVVDEVGGGFEVFLNDRVVPQVRIVPPGAALLRRADAPTRAFVGERMAQARWLLGSLTARQRTLVRLMRRIVIEQDGFFRRGVDGLRPLGYRELARPLGLHESTIARAVRGKHVATPRGVLPLRFFFSAGLACADGNARASAAVASRIRELIGRETGPVPLSDEVLTRRLQAEGLRIARRTVAKYRERLGIPRACCRKPI